MARHLPLEGVDQKVLGRSVERLNNLQAQTQRRYDAMRSGEARYQEYFGGDVLPESDQANVLASFDWPTMPQSWTDRRQVDDLQTALRTAYHSPRGHFAYSPVRVVLEGVGKPGVMVPHHLSHAAAAFYTSDRENSAIYTLDNGDGWSRAAGYTGGIYALGVGSRLLPIAPSYDIHGHFYQRVGEGIRLGHGGAAGKLMGLAPYGEPRFFDAAMVGNAFDVFGEAYALGDKNDGHRVLQHLLRAVEAQKQLGYEELPAASPFYDEAAFGAQDLMRPNIDLAMTAQAVFEENAVRTVARLKSAIDSAGLGIRSVALSGGGALNCPANSRILAERIFDDVFVPPYCDDSGLPLGAALALAHDVLSEPRQPMSADTSQGAYLGRSYDDSVVERSIADRRDRIIVGPAGDAARNAASDLAEGRIVAWFEGRSEVGPRALGHRSILADPRGTTTWRDVNLLKRREYWRPFAPAVLAEKADSWFSGGPSPSPFMLFNAQVNSNDLPAITHVDGSARLQTVDASAGGFRSLLEGFNDITGVPVVLNTSFNGPGEPIVETPDEALDFLLGSEIDAVYLNGRKVTRADS